MPFDDMEIIYAVFAGSAKREGFGKLAVINGNERGRAMADPA
jgi:hypothetical protein